MHTPKHTLIFLAVIFGLLGGLSFLFPEKGIYLSERFSLTFPAFNHFFAEKKSDKPDISKIIAIADAEEKIDKIKTDPVAKDSLIVESLPNNQKLIIDTTIKLVTTIQYKNAEKTSLSNFFNSLKNISEEPKSIRVLHYGDSQIEGDRISDYLRMKLQTQFGGGGPGLISLMPVAPSVINRISWSEGWDRYGIFSYRDKRVPHNNFGVMAHFCKFILAGDSSGKKTAWVKIITTKSGGAKATQYNKLKLFYGGSKSKMFCEFYDGGILKESDSLQKGGSFNTKEYSLLPNALNHEFKFTGNDSPDFYGVSLETGRGVMIDNMGLRGSSGTFFNQINYAQLKQFYDYLNVRLIILQFGGNTLPYLKDKAMAETFAGYLKSQIYTIKKMAPQASILVIGPADMSVKEGTEYVTHPLLEDLRNALRQISFDSDCAFFDMYDCMGGKNSMVAWVDQGIAAKDYIHFSPHGARKIATLLYASLINDYNNFLKAPKQ